MKCPECNGIEITETYRISTSTDLECHVLIEVLGDAYCSRCNRHFNTFGCKSIINDYPILVDKLKNYAMIDGKLQTFKEVFDSVNDDSDVSKQHFVIPTKF